MLDHVIVHELAHLVVPNHSPAFDALVQRNPLTERAIGYLMALNDRADPVAEFSTMADLPVQVDDSGLPQAG